MARIPRGALALLDSQAPPCFLTSVHQVRPRAFEGGLGAPRFLASERAGLCGSKPAARGRDRRPIQGLCVASGVWPPCGSRCAGRMRAHLGPGRAFAGALYITDGSHKGWMEVGVRFLCKSPP